MREENRFSEEDIFKTLSVKCFVFLCLTLNIKGLAKHVLQLYY